MNLTAVEVANRMAEAFLTLRRLPGERPRGYICCWPDIVQNVMEAYGYTPIQVPEGPPSAKAISEMDEALNWLWMLRDDHKYPERNLVIARACGVRWVRLEKRYCRNRSVLKKLWMEAILKVTQQLKKKAA